MMNFTKNMLCLQGFFVSLSIWYITALFHASTVSSSVSYDTIPSLRCFHRFFICVLRQHTVSSRFSLFHYLFVTSCSVLGFDCLFRCFLRHNIISSRFPLFLYLFVMSPYYFFKVSTVLLSVCYFTILSLQGFYCFIFCLLRHHTTSLRFSLFHYLFVTSVLCSWLRLSLPLFLTSLYYLIKDSFVSLPVCYVTILSLQGFHCFIICLLRHCSVVCFDCLFLCLLRHYTISSMFPLFHYLFVTSPYYLLKEIYLCSSAMLDEDSAS